MSHQPLRISALRQAMQTIPVDIVYIRSLSNIAWITGFDKVFDTEQAHAILVSPKKMLIHSDSRYSEALEREASSSEILVDARKSSHAQVLYDFACDFAAAQNSVHLDSIVTDSGSLEECAPMESMNKNTHEVIRIGIEDSLTLAEFHLLEKVFKQANRSSDLEGSAECSDYDSLEQAKSSPLSSYDFEFVELSSFVEKLREVKDDQELAYMKKAQAITDRAFSRIVDYMKEGMTERQVQLQLDAFMFEEGAEGLAFDTIVATGSHASSPHAIPGDTVLRSGDAVVMDFGAKYGGYCSDMTRTVFIGEPSDDLKQAWYTLQQVNETCEKALKAGIEASSIHQLAEDMLADAGYKEKMGHSLGHSVGIDIHESPALSPSNHKVLCEGNVVTVEPGIYIPGQFGMRLEDFGVVTSQGFDVFTKSSHKMFIIDKLN